MTEHELQLLLSGIAIGFQLAVAMFVFWQIRDSRREQKRAAAVLAEARAHLEADKAKESA
ncbi:hypothetical protein [Actinacidiphila glaucinigra]|uniref:hypothetical protein n=1 Tax=Actinacidiphila glaucinigra TaxID=235986 RepID=UPI002E306C9A|nr:hypothetical protein [Actinacidiphila glaucinigra]